MEESNKFRGMSKELFETVQEVINRKDRDNRIPVSMLDSYIVLRLNVESFIERAKRGNYAFNAQQFQEQVNHKIEIILKFWEKKFESDYDSYIGSLLNALYDKNTNLIEAMDGITSCEKTTDNLYFEKMYFYVNQMRPLRECYKYIWEKYPINDPKMNPDFLQPAKFYELIAELPPKYKSDDDLTSKLKEINRGFKSLQKDMKKFSKNYDREKYESAVAFLIERIERSNQPTENLYMLYEYFFKIRYLDITYFNAEAITLFLFCKHSIQEDKYPYLSLIKRKFEEVLKNIYNSLKKSFPHIEKLVGMQFDIPEEITEIYIYWEENFEPVFEKELFFMRLKKVVYLYMDYCRFTHIEKKDPAWKLLDEFSRVLEETKFFPTFYYIKHKDLLDYIKEMYQIAQKDIAKILGVSSSNISGHKDSIVRNNIWLFKALTDYSYTFLYEETTIPRYGIIDSDTNKYFTKIPVIVEAYAELILGRILSLNDYRKALKKSPKTRKKMSLTRKHNIEIAAKANELVPIIRKFRFKAENLFEKKTASERKLVQYERGTMYSKEEIKEAKDELEKNEREYENFISFVSNVLEKAIHSLKEISKNI